DHGAGHQADRQVEEEGGSELRVGAAQARLLRPQTQRLDVLGCFGEDGTDDRPSACEPHGHAGADAHGRLDQRVLVDTLSHRWLCVPLITSPSSFVNGTKGTILPPYMSERATFTLPSSA